MERKLFISKEELAKLYWEQSLSLSQIQRLLGCSHIDYWFKKYGILRRPPSCYHKAGFDHDLLYDMHHNQGLSLTEMADQLGLNHGSLTYRLQKFGIAVRHTTRKLHPKVSRESLLFLFAVQELCAREIAEMVGCSRAHIQRCLKFYGISRKSRPSRLNKLMGENKKRRWRTDRAHREKVMAANFAARAIKPNKAEQRLNEILKKHNLPFEYVGDGKVVLSGLVPDFINVNGRKEIIELFGDYWHGERATRPTQTEHGRGAIFKRFGFRTLVIWQHELSDENAVVAKVKAFQEARKVCVRE